LREYHDTTFAVWWDEEIGDVDDGYDWPIDHDRSIELLEEFLDARARGQLWADRTVRTKRYRLARYVDAYYAVTGREDLLEPVEPESDVESHEAIAEGSDAFARLDSEVGRVTLGRIFEVVDAWYDWLITKHLAAVNPVKAAGADYKFEPRSETRDGPANPALDPDHVRSLYHAAETPTERLVVVALCAWGLRSGEVAAMHTSQFVLEGDHPHIAFEERKNGPGTVSIIYGRDVLEDRIMELGDRESWGGYLFPSARSSTGHVHRGRINEWFDDLADCANLPAEVKGAKPVPQMGRRFWYDAYTSTMETLLEYVEDVAEEQGSASPEVVLSNYLEEGRKRELRRRFMREELAEAFGGGET